MIKIEPSKNIQIYPCFLLIDDYIPLSVQTYEDPIGARLLRLGDYAKSLMELALDPLTSEIRGVTVVSYRKIHDVLPLTHIVSVQGLPVASCPTEQFVGPEHARRIDLQQDFSLGFGPDFIDISLEGAPKSTVKYVYDDLIFYSDGEYLSGLRIENLPSDYIEACRRNVAA